MCERNSHLAVERGGSRHVGMQAGRGRSGGWLFQDEKGNSRSASFNILLISIDGSLPPTRSNINNALLQPLRIDPSPPLPLPQSPYIYTMVCIGDLGWVLASLIYTHSRSRSWSRKRVLSSFAHRAIYDPRTSIRNVTHRRIYLRLLLLPGPENRRVFFNSCMNYVRALSTAIFFPHSAAKLETFKKVLN